MMKNYSLTDCCMVDPTRGGWGGKVFWLQGFAVSDLSNLSGKHSS